MSELVSLPTPVALDSKKHKRDAFNCGREELDRYIRQFASQNQKNYFANCFVTVGDDDIVTGYYTLSSFSLSADRMPAAALKKLPRYPQIPCALMGRLAVDKTMQGRGLGELLLVDALTRVSTSEIAMFALAVDAKDEKAAAFYKGFGFIELVDNPLTLFLPVVTALDLIAGAE